MTTTRAFHRSPSGILRFSDVPGHPAGWGWFPCHPQELAEALAEGFHLTAEELQEVQERSGERLLYAEF
jgi:hypothetical protein